MWTTVSNERERELNLKFVSLKKKKKRRTACVFSCSKPDPFNPVVTEKYDPFFMIHTVYNIMYTHTHQIRV